MWTRNYYNLLTAAILGDSPDTSTSQPTDYTPPIRVKYGTGTYSSVTPYEYLADQSSGEGVNFKTLFTIGKGRAVLVTSNSANIDANKFGLSVGTGSTPATYEDYRMESIISSGVSIVNTDGTLTTPSELLPGNKYHSKRSFTINNTSVSNITINEVGIWAPNTMSSSSGPAILVYHEVLDTPVTLAPSESMIIAFDREATIYNYTPYPA